MKRKKKDDTFLNKTKSLVFGSDAFMRVLAKMPARMIYSKAYFEVMGLNKSAEGFEGAESVKRALKERLAYLLKDALTNVRYYADTVSISPKDVAPENAYDILKEFPYLEKKTVMENREDFINRRYDRRMLHYSTSSGSTGQGIVVWRSKREYDIEKSFFDYEYRPLGYSYFNARKVRIGTETRKTSEEEPWTFRGKWLLISPYHLNERWIEAIYDKVTLFGPDFFDTYPSCLEYLAKYMEDTGKPRMKVRGVLLASEMMTEHQHGLFSRVFDGPIRSSYGLTERTNLAFSEDDGNGGFHFKLNDVYGFSETAEDEFGNHEIIGTSYWNEAMPFIRYRTKDYGKIKDGRINALEGRNREFLIGRKGERISGFSVKVDEFSWDYIYSYQIVQKKKGEIMIRVFPNSKFTEGVLREMEEKQKERWGGFFDIDFETTDEMIRTPSGKFMMIMNMMEDIR